MLIYYSDWKKTFMTNEFIGKKSATNQIGFTAAEKSIMCLSMETLKGLNVTGLYIMCMTNHS